jgi:EmrB/QacA subfamily drug resistance transporter
MPYARREMMARTQFDPVSDFAALRSRKLRLLIPLTVAFAFMMEQLDSTIITTAIPDIARSLDVSALQMNVAITSYILSLAVFIPVSGWFADRYGARRVFVCALLLFSGASALCGMCDTLPQMVGARLLQGLGGAMMTPVGRLILLRSFPRSEMATAMTYMTIPAVIGPTMGPLLGGAITTYFGWRWLFYVNIPLGLLGVALALRVVEDAKLAGTPRFDTLGFVLCGVGLAALQFSLEMVGHPVVAVAYTWAMLAAAVVLLGTYGRYATRRAHPSLDLTLFKERTFRISTLAGGMSRMGANTVPFMLPLMLQIGFGLSPVQSGSLTFVMSMAAAPVRPISGVILRWWGFRAVLAGNGVICAGAIATFALVESTTPHWLVFLLVLVFGVVRAAQFMTTNMLTYADLPEAKLSRGTSLGGVIQQLTISFGVSIAAALLSLAAGRDNMPTVADFHLVFVLVAGITLLSVPLFFVLRPDDGAVVTGQRQPGPSRLKPASSAGR